MDSILPLLKNTRKASAQLRRLSNQEKEHLLNRLAIVVAENEALIMAENQKDMDRMPDDDPKKDRLFLNPARIKGLVDSLNEVAVLPDPAGQLIFEKTLPNGLIQQKLLVPMGVVGVIYESRPNVTLDVAALCLRSGNACVLKGGKEASFSNNCIVGLIHQVLAEFGIDPSVVMLLPTDRKFVNELLEATQFVDLIIPRGSDALIQFVRKNSLIPTIETGAGVCHTYVESTADLNKAVAIVINARVSRPSVCNSLDCLIVDVAVAKQFLPMLCADLKKWNVRVYADQAAYAIFEMAGFEAVEHAKEEDFGREWLDYKLSVKTVSGFNEALEHIENYSSKHSEAIMTQNEVLAEQFLQEVDAATVYHNASTRFTDGGVFGLGAEIGISTQKLHARGPFALEKLVTEKWVLRGDGQVRW
jgi:glutamate-5-semialdehyde dehydrogenase